MSTEKQDQNNSKLSRRDILAGLAALPVVGVIGYGLLRNKADAEKRNSSLLSDIKPEVQNGIPPLIVGDTLRVGIIGSGGRGGYLMKALGFVNPDRIDEYTEKGKTDKCVDHLLDCGRYLLAAANYDLVPDMSVKDSNEDKRFYTMEEERHTNTGAIEDMVDWLYE